MGLLLLEALGALLLLVLMVWWTMFCGRSKGELTAPRPAVEADAAQADTDAAALTAPDHSAPATAPGTTPAGQNRARH